MTVLNFPASPSVNDVYEANGVVYTWTGAYWKSNNVSPTLDETYVQVAGDTMTGSLTVPGFSAGRYVQVRQGAGTRASALFLEDRGRRRAA